MCPHCDRNFTNISIMQRRGTGVKKILQKEYNIEIFYLTIEIQYRNRKHDFYKNRFNQRGGGVV